MAKKLAEEAIEVVIDAVNGNTEAVVRESADLLYNLTVLWAAAGVKPEDVWREMARREDLLGIAEKLPKSAIKPMEKPAAKMPKSISGKALPSKARLAKAVAPSAVRRRIVALEGRSSHKRH
jgi:phosphoribosyl-ATP pyrophosphohydrolase